MKEHLLDNPVWHALQTGNRPLSHGPVSIKYFSKDVAPFAGLIQNTPQHLTTLHELFPYDVCAIVATAPLVVPDCWKSVQHMDIFQMVCSQPHEKRSPENDMVPLQEKDVPAMLALTQLTSPGPFSQHTIRFGHYEGIFSGDRLVAMAGQRLHPEPYAEISAVCTHPDFTGKGFAARLIAHQVQRMQAASSIPFLHVKKENERAIQLYRHLGFSVRKEILIYVLKKN